MPLPNQRVINFETRPPGPYSKQMMKADTKKQLKWYDSDNRLMIAVEPASKKTASKTTSTEESASPKSLNRFLRVTYPIGGVGPKQSGAQFKINLVPADEYIFEYRLRLQPGFDFRKGGKLPGICGGACNTGKRKPDGTGWSLRYMWREEGKLFAYLYHMNQPDDYGEYLPLGVSLKPGRWYKLLQRVKLNRPGANDGQLQIWMDGKQLLTRKDIAYRNTSKTHIDTFYFSTFYGGSSNAWAPKVTSLADFDDFRFEKR